MFLVTFRILATLLEDRAFGWVNRAGTIVRGFAVYHFEAFKLGIQPYLNRIDLTDATQVTKLIGVLEGIKRESEFQQITSGGGRNSRGALDRRISFVQDTLGRAL